MKTKKFLFIVMFLSYFSFEGISQDYFRNYLESPFGIGFSPGRGGENDVNELMLQSGITYGKFLRPDFSIKIGFNGAQLIPLEPSGYYILERKYKRYNFNAGVKYFPNLFKSKSIRPIVGMDLYYGYSEAKGNYYGCVTSGPIDTKTNHFGTKMSAGLEFNLSKRFYVGITSSIDFEKRFSTDYTAPVPTKSNSFGTYWTPLTFTIGFRF